MEDRINLHQLMELKAAFERADTDQGGSLDMEEFLEAFGGVLGENLTTTQLIHLFMKIDTNSDGSVDWDEFTSFSIETGMMSSANADDFAPDEYAVEYHYDRAYVDKHASAQPQPGKPVTIMVHMKELKKVLVGTAGTEIFELSAAEVAAIDALAANAPDGSGRLCWVNDPLRMLEFE